MTDAEAAAKLRTMWTPEMFDRFEADLRELFRKNPPPVDAAMQEKLIADLKAKAIELAKQRTS